jgi:CRP/FNR family transcriptional regulator, dissimilatory nitrate respiration regulator
MAAGLWNLRSSVGGEVPWAISTGPGGSRVRNSSDKTMHTSVSELKQAAIVNSLRQCKLFAGVPSEDLRNIATFTAVKLLSTGDYLFHEGDTSCGFFIVQKGAINVHRVNAAGKEQVIHVFRAGESFAEATLATDRGYPADARAVEPSQVLLVQKSGFLSLLQRHPELGLRMLNSMSFHLRELIEQIEDLTMKDVETRLANWLLKRCPNREVNEPVEIDLKTTKSVLAAEIGTVSETLSRTFAKMREQNLIEVKGRTVTVLQPGRLLHLLKVNLGE